MAWNCACWCIITTFTNNEIMVTVCWCFKFWHYFDLKRSTVSFPGIISWRESTEILHADVSWLPSELIRSWQWSVDFTSVASLWLSETGQNWGFPCIFWRTHVGNGLILCMLMYLGHFQKWLEYSHGLMIFEFWRYYDFVKCVKLCFSGFSRRMHGIASNFACWCNLTTFKTD